MWPGNIALKSMSPWNLQLTIVFLLSALSLGEEPAFQGCAGVVVGYRVVDAVPQVFLRGDLAGHHGSDGPQLQPLVANPFVLFGHGLLQPLRPGGVDLVLRECRGAEANSDEYSKTMVETQLFIVL